MDATLESLSGLSLLRAVGRDRRTMSKMSAGQRHADRSSACAFASWKRLDELLEGMGCPLFAPWKQEKPQKGATKMPVYLRFCLWGGVDSNHRPTDYESAALTD